MTISRSLAALSLVLVIVLGTLLSTCAAQRRGDSNSRYMNELHHQGQSGPEMMELIKRRGFIGELYTIPSRDGAPISIYHVINPLADPRTLNRFPVLLFHGIGGDAAQMLGHSERARPRRPVPGQLTFDVTDTCLAFTLANNNFDLWMVDARGTNLNNHLAAMDFNPMLGNKYWNFSLDEQAFFDLPATIDFVLEHTLEPKLHYIGFSESTFFMFALLSTHTEYQDKLASFVAMAPVAYVWRASGSAIPALASLALIPDSINANVITQPLTDTFGIALRKMCQFEFVARTLCMGISASFSGVGANEVSHGFFATSLKATSIKAAKHFVQLYLQRRFGMYDHGEAGNLRAYGQARPPNYDLSKIRMPPLILLRGGRDALSDPLDQQQLISELGVKPYLDSFIPHFNHLDFIMSSEIIERINVPITRAMFHLLHLFTTAQGLPFTRDPRKLALPKRYKPVALAIPDGKRAIEIQSNLANDAINGVVESMGSGPASQPLAKLDLAMPLTPSLLQQPLKLLRDVAAGFNLGG